MEPAIIRTRFFDGQFLQEAEFRTEQLYHLHMRRRWGFALFDRSGVVQAAPTDLRVTQAGQTTIQIAPGLAIGRVAADREAREVVLVDPVTLDLAVAATLPLNPGIADGELARITLHYDELETANPPSAGDVPGDTRFEEQAVITVHNADPPLLAPNNEPYIRLANVSYDLGTGTMTIDTAGPARDLARLNGALLGIAPPAPLTAIVLGPPGASVGVSGTLPLVATGQFSSGPDQPLTSGLIWTSSDPGVVTVDGSGVATGVTAGNATITAASGAITSAGLPITVTAVAPALSIDAVSPNAANQGTQFSVFGNGLHDSSIATGQPAAGTTVTFTVAAEPANSVVVSGADVSVRATDPSFPASGQVLQVRAPARASFPGPTTPGAFSTVDLTIAFDGDSATAAFTFSN